MRVWTKNLVKNGRFGGKLRSGSIERKSLFCNVFCCIQRMILCDVYVAFNSKFSNHNINKSHIRITSCYFLAVEITYIQVLGRQKIMAQNNAASQLVLKGTTTVGVVCKDGVILASDTRVTMGYYIAHKFGKKV
jgi:hypothetical protein